MACYWKTCLYDVWRKSPDLVCFEKLLSAAVWPSKGLVRAPARVGLPGGAGQPADVGHTVQEIQLLEPHEAAVQPCHWLQPSACGDDGHDGHLWGRGRMGHSHGQHSTLHPTLQWGLATTASPGPDLRAQVPFRRKDSKTKKQILLPLISLWINIRDLEIKSNLDSCSSLGQIQAQKNKKKPSVEATTYFPCTSHSTTPLITHIDYFCMKIFMPIP